MTRENKQGIRFMLLLQQANSYHGDRTMRCRRMQWGVCAVATPASGICPLNDQQYQYTMGWLSAHQNCSRRVPFVLGGNR
jgi:hypothetical protein